MAVSSESIVRALGLILSNASVYGAEHSVCRQSVDACFETLREAWAEGAVRITLADEVLSINGAAVDLRNRLAQLLADHFAARGLTDVTLQRGMTREQFAAVMETIEAKPEELRQLGGFAGAIESVGLSNVVSCRKRVYREVAEDQEVIEREWLAAFSRAGEMPEAAAETAKEQEDQAAAREATEAARAVIDWVKGGGEVTADAASQAIREMIGDASELAGRITEAAGERAAEDDTDATMGTALVDALQRVYTALTDDPSFHTQKTKKQIQRTLTQLEQELADKLDALDLPDADESRAALHDAVEALADDLTVDALAQEYARKRNAIETSERRVMRYVKRKGLDGIEDSELKQRLIESGLDEAGWQELLARCVPPAAKADAAADGGVTPLPEGLPEALADHLARVMETTLPDRPYAPPPTEAELKQNLEPVRQAVETVFKRAFESIGTLAAEIEGGDGEADREAPPSLTRKRLFEILAELGQELCQPLAVITCTLDMMRGGNLGDVNAMQTEMLDTAAESGDKLKTLIDRLIEIAGLPTGRTVDKSIQASLYESR